MPSLFDQLPDEATNPNPKLLDHLSARLRKHITQPDPEKEPKFHVSASAGITASVSTALHAQAHQYTAEQQPPLSLSKLVQTAVIKFITQRQLPPCPVTFTPKTKFAPRNRVFSAAIPRGIYEELQAFAEKHGLTVVAVVRRAVYEHTKPEAPENPDPAATIDAWADRAR